MKVLFAITGWSPDAWLERFAALAPEIAFIDARTPFELSGIRAAVVWKPEPGLLARLPDLAAIFNLGAGVDALLGDPTLPDVPLVRVVDPDLTQRMTEYVVFNALRAHRHDLLHRAAQAERRWIAPPQPAASAVMVGIMGLGVLGRDAASALRRIGFQVVGWSRSPQTVPGVETFAGRDGLGAFLARTEILVVLLPLTPDTRAIINRACLAGLNRTGPLGAAHLINAGRGGLQVEADILAALDAGEIATAALDVFETEPLPPDNPLWSHPRVLITPHNAADSDPDAVCAGIVEGLRALERGAPLRNVVDRATGY